VGGIDTEYIHQYRNCETSTPQTEAVESLLGNQQPAEATKLKAAVRITNANTRYEDDLAVSERYSGALSVLSDRRATEKEKAAAEKEVKNIVDEQTAYFQEQLDTKLKGIDAKVTVANTYGYWQSGGEHSFEVTVDAKTKEDYFKAVGRLADFSSEQSQDAFIEVVELTADEIAVLEADGIELLNTKMEDGSSVTSEIRFAFENSLSLTEIALLSKALEGKGIKDFTASENGFSVIYLSEKSNEQRYNKWATKLNQTFKDYFNGRTNNYTSEENIVRTWYHASDNQDTRSRTFKSVKGNLQTRYGANPGFGNKRRGTKRDNGKQEGEQEGSRDDIGESDVNHSLDTQQFFTDVENGKHRPSKDLQFILPLNAALKKIHQVWSKFKGHFDEHIETNIPVFREVQLRKINAILSMLPNGGRVIDLGGSTGSFVKAISTLNPKIYSENLDANPRMGETHNAAPVKNSVFVNKLFAETFDGATLEVYKPTEKFDVVHESMLFQFIKEDRTAFVDEIADNMLPPPPNKPRVTPIKTEMVNPNTSILLVVF